MNKLAAIARMNPDAIRKVAQMNPLTGGLMGAGLGAGIGAGYTYLTEKDPERRKSKLKTAIMTGVLAGGTGGAALGMLSAPNQMEQLSPTRDEIKYKHPGMVMLPIAPWLYEFGHKGVTLHPWDRLKNVGRRIAGHEPKPVAPTYQMHKARAAGIQLGLSALSGLAGEDVVRDMARAQAAGDTPNIILDTVANPVSAGAAYLSNRPWGRKVLSPFQDISSTLFGVNLYPDQPPAQR